MNGDRNDPGLDAQIHSTLDQLSNDGSISATQQSDGTWTVLLNGQTPLVIEEPGLRPQRRNGVATASTQPIRRRRRI